MSEASKQPDEVHLEKASTIEQLEGLSREIVKWLPNVKVLERSDLIGLMARVEAIRLSIESQPSEELLKAHEALSAAETALLELRKQVDTLTLATRVMKEENQSLAFIRDELETLTRDEIVEKCIDKKDEQIRTLSEENAALQLRLSELDPATATLSVLPPNREAELVEQVHQAQETAEQRIEQNAQRDAKTIATQRETISNLERRLQKAEIESVDFAKKLQASHEKQASEYQDLLKEIRRNDKLTDERDADLKKANEIHGRIQAAMVNGEEDLGVSVTSAVDALIRRLRRLQELPQRIADHEAFILKQSECLQASQNQVAELQKICDDLDSRHTVRRVAQEAMQKEIDALAADIRKTDKLDPSKMMEFLAKHMTPLDNGWGKGFAPGTGDCIPHSTASESAEAYAHRTKTSGIKAAVVDALAEDESPLLRQAASRIPETITKEMIDEAKIAYRVRETVEIISSPPREFKTQWQTDKPLDVQLAEQFAEQTAAAVEAAVTNAGRVLQGKEQEIGLLQGTIKDKDVHIEKLDRQIEELRRNLLATRQGTPIPVFDVTEIEKRDALIEELEKKDKRYEIVAKKYGWPDKGLLRRPVFEFISETLAKMFDENDRRQQAIVKLQKIVDDVDQALALNGSSGGPGRVDSINNIFQAYGTQDHLIDEAHGKLRELQAMYTKLEKQIATKVMWLKKYGRRLPKCNRGWQSIEVARKPIDAEIESEDQQRRIAGLESVVEAYSQTLKELKAPFLFSYGEPKEEVFQERIEKLKLRLGSLFALLKRQRQDGVADRAELREARAEIVILKRQAKGREEHVEHLQNIILGRDAKYRERTADKKRAFETLQRAYRRQAKHLEQFRELARDTGWIEDHDAGDGVTWSACAWLAARCVPPKSDLVAEIEDLKAQLESFKKTEPRPDPMAKLFGTMKHRKEIADAVNAENLRWSLMVAACSRKQLRKYAKLVKRNLTKGVKAANEQAINRGKPKS